MQIRSLSQIRPQQMTGTGYSKVTGRLAAGPREGCRRISLRQLVIQPGGHTPRESCRGERVFLVLAGAAEVVDADGFAHEISGGDVIIVPAWEMFHFQNRGGSDLSLVLLSGPDQ